MESNLSFAKKIGNFVSNILLGDTKEIIIRMDERILSVSKRIDIMEPDLKSLNEKFSNFRERFAVLEDRMSILWKDETAPTRSPRKLNEKGNNILFKSGIKEVIDQKKEELFKLVRSKNIGNPYDAEEYVLQIVADLKKDSVLVEGLKTGAYSVGASIDTVLFVGGIYLRDQIFPELGFSVDQIDLHKNE